MFKISPIFLMNEVLQKRGMDDGGNALVKRFDVHLLNISTHRTIGLGVKYRLAEMHRNSRLVVFFFIYLDES